MPIHYQLDKTNFYKDKTANVSLDSKHECSRIDTMHTSFVSRNGQVHVPQANDNVQEFLNRGVDPLHKSFDQRSTRRLNRITDHNESCYLEIDRAFHKLSPIAKIPVSGNRNAGYIKVFNIDNTDRIPKSIPSTNILSDSSTILKKNNSSSLKQQYLDPRSGCITFDSSKSRITMPQFILRRRSHWNCDEQ